MDANLEAAQEIVLQQIVQLRQALVDVDAAVDDVLPHLLTEIATEWEVAPSIV